MNLSIDLSSNTGFNERYISEVIKLLTLFSEDAIELGSIYCKHAGRNNCTKEDISKALKARAYHGDEFWNLPNVQERLQAYDEELLILEGGLEEGLEEGSEEGLEEDFEEGIEEGLEEGLEEEWTSSNCTCEVCDMLNQVDDLWKNWEPSDDSVILKNAIDEATNN